MNNICFYYNIKTDDHSWIIKSLFECRKWLYNLLNLRIQNIEAFFMITGGILSLDTRLLYILDEKEEVWRVSSSPLSDLKKFEGMVGSAHHTCAWVFFFGGGGPVAYTYTL